MWISLASTLFDAGVFCLFGFFLPFGFVLFLQCFAESGTLMSVRHFNAHLLW